MTDSDAVPNFNITTYDDLGEYLHQRVPADQRSALVFEPSSADELPGRRVLLGDQTLCRVVPDPSDPRPLPMVVGRLIDAAGQRLANSGVDSVASAGS